VGVWQGEVYIIDTTGRLQVFDAAGEFVRHWMIPETENGTPTAITFHDDGRVLVPDTHNSRILEYDREGTLLTQWGRFGTAPDAFIYPTGLAMGADGAFFISEYGQGAERVHVFDAARTFRRQWGSHGEAPGQFNRAMAIGLNRQQEVLVADTANHRIQCFKTDGTWLRDIGSPGTEPGQLKFPHDMTVGPDDTIYVAEYGAHRVSRFDPDGTLIEIFGSAGRGPGELNAPRGVAVAPDGQVYVADTDNHRIQIFEARQVAV
jgi:DNA-binding beta-propeller fold protein YncE